MTDEQKDALHKLLEKVCELFGFDVKNATVYVQHQPSSDPPPRTMEQFVDLDGWVAFGGRRNGAGGFTA